MKRLVCAAVLLALAGCGSAWCTPPMNIGGPDATWHRVDLGGWEAGVREQ